MEKLGWDEEGGGKAGPDSIGGFPKSPLEILPGKAHSMYQEPKGESVDRAGLLRGRAGKGQGGGQGPTSAREGPGQAEGAVPLL